MIVLVFSFLLIATGLITVSGERKSEELKEFIEWFQSNGGIADGVTIHDFGLGMGMGVQCTRNISESKRVLQVPHKIILSVKSMLLSEDETHVKLAKEFKTSNENAVIAYLLLEKFRATLSLSLFTPYVKVLPEYVPSLTHFSIEELSLLENRALQNDVIDAQLRMKNEYIKFQRAVQRIYPADVFDHLTLESYRWASTIVDSRGLRFRGEVYLVPFADMFNYSPHPNFRQSAAGEFYLKHHILSNTDLSILADRPQAAGEQLFEDYGDNEDKIYLQYHGFVPRENPFRCVVIVSPHDESASDQHTSLLKALRFTQPPSACIRSDGVLGKAMEVYISAIVFSSSEIDACLPYLKRVQTNKGTWDDVFKGCGFSEVSEALGRRQFETIPPGSLAHRVHSKVQQLIEASEPSWTSSIAEDELLLEELGAALSTAAEASASGDGQSHAEQQLSIKALTHRQLAVRYRIAVKTAWQKLKASYGIISSSEPKQTAPVEKSASTVVDIASDGSIVTSSMASNIGDASLGQSTAVNYTFKDDELSLEDKLVLFNEWFQNNKPLKNSLTAVAHPLFRIGTLATTDIKFEDVYLGVPLSVILDSDKAYTDAKLGPMLQAITKKYNGGRDDMHELLFYLVQERLDRKSESFFWPYLRLLPTAEELDVPTLWSDEEVRERLAPSAILPLVLHYRASIRKLYDQIMSMELISEFFPRELLSYENYLWATVILDSRSIWWEGKRHLVPMLDFINCKEGPNPSVVHSTKREGSFAVTKSPWGFSAGEQVFENYGQPNYIYFMYHGFILSEEAGGNSHDCVNFELALTEGEKALLDVQKAAELAQRYRINVNSREWKMSFCLHASVGEIPANAWYFLSMKANDGYATFDGRSQKTQGTIATRRLLASLVDARLKLYRGHSTRYLAFVCNSHASSAAFLASEAKILSQAIESLAQGV